MTLEVKQKNAKNLLCLEKVWFFRWAYKPYKYIRDSGMLYIELVVKIWYQGAGGFIIFILNSMYYKTKSMMFARKQLPKKVTWVNKFEIFQQVFFKPHRKLRSVKADNNHEMKFIKRIKKWHRALLTQYLWLFTTLELTHFQPCCLA